jgi:hypothetical protein
MVVPTVYPLRLRLSWKLRWRLSYVCTTLFCTDKLMKPHGSIRVVRMWCGVCTDPVLRCFGNPEGPNYGDLLIGIVP